MQIDNYGQVIVNADDVFNSLYNGIKISFGELVFDNETAVLQFNESVDKNADNISKVGLYKPTDIPIKEFDNANQINWFMPSKYQNFEIVEFLLDQTTTDIEHQRVVNELELFAQHNMIDVLKYLKYLVDTMREHNIVWGVGRGSSVASYVLYLIGVHKINSIKYELDITEFLK
jgi:hypothetical protein